MVIVGGAVFLTLHLPALDRLQSELIRDGLADEVVGDARVNKRRVRVVIFAAQAFAEVHQDHEVW